MCLSLRGCAAFLLVDPAVLWGWSVRARERHRSRKTRQRMGNVRGALSSSPLVSLAHHQLCVSSFHVSFSPSLVKCEVGVAAVITPPRWELPKKKKQQTVTDQCQKNTVKFQSLLQPNYSAANYALFNRKQGLWFMRVMYTVYGCIKALILTLFL